jgi:hypothetical protein
MAIVGSFALVLSSITRDNLRSQMAGSDRALQFNRSSAIHVKYLTHMTNGVLTTPVSMANLARRMYHLADLQKLLRSLQDIAEVGLKCPKFVWISFFDTVETSPLTHLHRLPKAGFPLK